MTRRGTYDTVAAQIRRPPQRTGRDDAELIRMAALAASSHNTQPWTFSTGPGSITIRADLTRRCPAVDPDDAHLYRSLGCAAENIVQAAPTQGLVASVVVDESNAVVVHLAESAGAGAAPLAAAITTRQCTRDAYDSRPIEAGAVAALERAGTLGSARCIVLTDTPQLHALGDFVTRGDLVQLNDPEFRSELVSWIRFNAGAALRTGDGLAGRTTGQPSVPTWVGTTLQRVLIRASQQAELNARRLATSAGAAVFVTPREDVAAWVDAGRAYERFALQAEALDVRTAFINQPIEVPGLRPHLESWLGLSGERAQLAVRFGRGPKLPYSLRRPIQDVTLSSAP